MAHERANIEVGLYNYYKKTNKECIIHSSFCKILELDCPNGSTHAFFCNITLYVHLKLNVNYLVCGSIVV